MIASDVGIDLGIGTLKVCVRDDGGCPVAWTDDIHYVGAVFADDPVQVDVDQVEPGRGSEMS